jgi:hypothetical protein
MKIGVLNGKLNRWQAGIAWGKAPTWQGSGYWYVHLWCMKLRSLPPQREMISKQNYVGLRFFKAFYPQRMFTRTKSNIR